jgi:adhesin transport system membrane fusion protein
MSRLDAVVKATPASFRWLGWIIMTLLTAMTIWAYFAELEEVTIAIGEVVPQGQVKVIQHLEGGIIEKLHVREGDVVKAGDPLVQLDLTASGTKREELAVRLDALLITRARLSAEANGKKPIFPEDVSKRRPEILASERGAYKARQSELGSGMKVLRQQVLQREQGVAEMRAHRDSLTRDLELTREEFAMSTSLLEDKLTPKIEHLKLQREVEEIKGQLKTLDAGIPRAKAAFAEARERLIEERLKFRRIAQDDLGKVAVAIAQTRETLAQATDEVLRTEIRSPIDGIVKSTRYHTIGGVVRPGEALMEIVPTEDRLVIEARLNPTDVGYVRVGQPAVVKITTYDFVRYGGLDAEVIYLSPDSNTDDSGQTFFRVIARTEKNYLGVDAEDLPIAPGMEATIDIHTGSKSVLTYLVKPVLKLKNEAFRER